MSRQRTLKLCLFGGLLTALAAGAFWSVAQAQGPGVRTLGVGQRWAVLIGCKEYPLGLSLPATKYDIDRLRKQLQDAGYKVIVMDDRAINPWNNNTYEPENFFPSKENIERQLPIWFPKGSLGAGDTILFFFTGHGIRYRGVDYLVPAREEPKEPPPVERLITVPWVYDQMRLTGAENIVIITDCCREVKDKSLRSTSTFGEGAAETLQKLPVREQRFAWLRSCLEGQFSRFFPNEEWGSYYTYYLAEGLSGKADGAGSQGQVDGTITVAEAHAYAKTMVVEEARKRNQEQVPQINTAGEEVERIALVGRPVVPPPPPRRNEPPRLTIDAPPALARGEELLLGLEENEVVVTGHVTDDAAGVKLYAGKDEMPLTARKDYDVRPSWTFTVRWTLPAGEAGPWEVRLEAVDAGEQRATWAGRLRRGGNVRVNPKDGAAMVWIPGGTFEMGSDKKEIDEIWRKFKWPEDWKRFTQAVVSQI